MCPVSQEEGRGRRRNPRIVFFFVFFCPAWEEFFTKRQFLNISENECIMESVFTLFKLLRPESETNLYALSAEKVHL